MCRAMVINYGFSDVGPWSLMDQGSQSPDMIMRMMSRNSISETLQHKIDIAVRKIADEAYEAALQHIRYHSSCCTLACCMQCTGFACSGRIHALMDAGLHRNNREAMDKIVDELLVMETIRGENFRDILSHYSKIPAGEDELLPCLICCACVLMWWVQEDDVCAIYFLTALVCAENLVGEVKDDGMKTISA